MHPPNPPAHAQDAVSAEDRARFEARVVELCDVLGVDRPGPPGSGYAFWRSVTTTSRAGEPLTRCIDLHRGGSFILVRHTPAGRDTGHELAPAYGRAKSLAAAVPEGPPPHVMVMDAGRTLRVWDRWTGEYGPFAAARHVDLRELRNRPRDLEFLRAVWTDPRSLDPHAGLRRRFPGAEIGHGPQGWTVAVREETVAPLLDALLESGMGFHLYDPLYPSPSDPGAYFTYTPVNGSWSARLGNHGWSGGPYPVEPAVVCLQVRNLAATRQLRLLGLGSVPSARDVPEPPRGSGDINRRLLQVHGGAQPFPPSPG